MLIKKQKKIATSFSSGFTLTSGVFLVLTVLTVSATAVYLSQQSNPNNLNTNLSINQIPRTNPPQPSLAPREGAEDSSLASEGAEDYSNTQGEDKNSSLTSEEENSSNTLSNEEENDFSDNNTSTQTLAGIQTESDPIFTLWNKQDDIKIKESQIKDLQDYLTDLSSFTTNHLTEGTTNQYFTTNRAISALTGQNLSLFNNDSGYLTQEADPIFSSWNKSAGITITESQITNLQSYLTSISGLDISLLTNNSNYITDGNTNWNNEYNFITASTSDTLTNKVGNISMWTNDSNYITDGNTNWNNEYSFITNLSTFTTDNLTQGTTNKYSQWTTSGTTISYLNNVGIGTTTPQNKLHLFTGDGTSGLKTGLICSNSTSSKLLTDASGNLICGVDQTGSGTGNLIDTLADTLAAGNDANNLGIINLGNIGIGTTTPTTALQIGTSLNITSLGAISGASGNISMWTNDSAYLTSYTETDPVFLAHQAHNITASHLTILGNTSNTNTGDETQSSIQTKLGTATTTTSGYLTSTDWNIFNNKQPAGSYLTGTKVDSFNTRTGAVTLSISDVTTALTFTPYNATNPAGYISSYTETDPVFSAWDKSAGISITESQISNLQSYLTSISGLNISLLTNNSNYITDGNTNWNNEYSFIAASSSDTLTNKAGNISMWTNDSNYLTNLSSLTTDNLTQGTTNKYSQWVTSGSNISFVGGNVGIGTTGADQLLSINGAINTNRQISFQAGGVVKAYCGLGTDNVLRLSTVDSDSLALVTNLSTRLIVEGTGNVGIGTTAPVTKLDVNGSIKIGGGSITTGLTRLTVSAGDTVLYTPVVFQLWGTDQTGVSNITADIKAGYTTAGWENRYLSFNVGQPGALATMERMRINSQGSVGIGTTSPLRTLSIQGGGMAFQEPAGSSRSIHWGDSNTDTWPIMISGTATLGNETLVFSTNTFGNNGVARMLINSSGNVGIGTTSPGAKLQIGGGLGNLHIAGYDGSFLIKGITTGRSLFEIHSPDGTSRTVLQNLDSNGATYLANLDGRNLLLQTSGGNVGIGMTTPSQRLHVVGGVILGGQIYVSPSNGNTLNSGYDYAGDDADIWINYRGHNDTHSYFRDFRIGNGKGGQIAFFDGSANTANKPGGGTWGDSSDQRLKKNIKTYEDALEKISNLRGVTFDWINPEEHGGIVSQGGFIAQEVEKFFPSWVKNGTATGGDLELIESNDSSIKTLSIPFDFDALTVEAIKQLNLKKADLTLLTTNQNAIDQNFNLLGERITTLENWIPVFTGMTEKQTEMTEDLSQLTLTTEQLTTDYTNLELRVLELETTLAGIEVGFELPEEFQTLKQALENANIEFDAEGNLKVKKIEAEEMELGVESSGKTFLPTEESEIEIFTSAVNLDSKIYITVTDKLENRSLYIDQETIQEGESFVVKLEGELSEKDLRFNWLIIN